MHAQLNQCIACQVRLYAKADILVGIHGAGLTNLMFMRPGGTLVEITGEFDGRMAPGTYLYIYIYMLVEDRQYI